ncbi:MAG: apolipoprotein N-acyltransferase [Nocardioides sp.]|nr:apolipoprotein N-acyltransferase [Nocardioides sp.]
MLLRLLAVACAGAVLSLAYEPVAVPYVAPLSLAALALALRGRGLGGGFLLGLVFGAAFYYPHIHWMASSISLFSWLALAGIEAVFYGLWGLVATRLLRLPAWPAWLALAWVVAEAVRMQWPWSGMPWGRLGFAVVDTPLAPALAYVGINGVSVLVALIGFLLARLLLTLRAEAAGERLAAAAGLVGVVAVSLVPVALPWTLDGNGEVTVAAVQGDVPGRGNDVLVDPVGITENHAEVTDELAAAVAAGTVSAPDLVVWPENSTARDPFTDAYVGSLIDGAVARIGVPVLVGAMVGDGPDHVLNQGVVWDPATGAGERYTKRHPVAFGEYIPLRRWLADLVPQFDRIPRDMRTGTRTTPLDVAGVPVADAICFDIAYEDGLTAQIRNGAELVTVQTSNASFIFTDQVEQQFAITRAQAIATGKYVVVASTNGVSGVIAPDGEVLARTDRLTQDVLVATVERRVGETPALAVGAALPLLGAASIVVGLALSARPYRRRGRSGDPDPAVDERTAEPAGA